MAHINLPKDSEGWTIFTPSVDSRIMYISEAGSDVSGAPHAYDDFADPFNPTGEDAFKTYAEAFTYCRDDHPDWILFKRGDEFVDYIGLDIPVGRSETEPSLIGDYGATGALPVLKIGANRAIDFMRGAEFLAFSNVDIYAHTADPDGVEFVEYTGGVYMGGALDPGYSLNGLLVEGCKFRFTAGGGIQKHKGDACGSIIFRRNLFYKNYVDESHCSGIYIDGSDGTIIDENIFYHNGWLIQNYTGVQGDASEGQATTFNHNLYLTKLKTATITNNLLIEGSNSGLKMTSYSPDGSNNITITDNLILGGEIGIDIGNNGTGELRRFQNIVVNSNVFTNIGWSRPTDGGLAWYTWMDGWAEGEFKDNLLLSQANTINNNTKGIYLKENMYNVEISGNTVHGLLNCTGLELGEDTSGYATEVSGVVINNNTVHVPADYLYVTRTDYDNSGIVTITDNKYYCESGAGDYRYINTVDDFDEWVAATGDTSTIEQVSFFDNTRDIASYNVSAGGTASIQAFIDECILQDRYNWNTDYEASAVNNYLRAGFAEVFMTTTFNAPNTWNNSNNKYKYPEGTPLTAADALQNLAGDGPVMFDGSGNSIPRTQAELVALPEMNNNKQVYGCFEEGGTGMAQYENTNTIDDDAEVKDHFSCL